MNWQNNRAIIRQTIENMLTDNRYKIEVVKKKFNHETKEFEIIRLPSPKSTNIEWTALVAILVKHGIAIAKEIRLHNVGKPNGTRKINRDELLSLWRAVESKRKAN